MTHGPANRAAWLLAAQHRHLRASEQMFEIAVELTPKTAGKPRKRRLEAGEEARLLFELGKARNKYILPLASITGHKTLQMLKDYTHLGAEKLGAILAELPGAAILEGDADEHGQRLTADLQLRRGNRSAVVRTAWIIRAGEDFPRLVTCFVV